MEAIFNTSFATCILMLLLAMLGLMWRRELIDRLGVGLNIFAAIVLAVYMAMRWMEAGHPPLSNLFESLVMFALSILIIKSVVYLKVRMRFLDVGLALMSVLTLAYATKNPAEIRPLIPALQSNWLVTHVATCMFAYAGFAVSFFAAIRLLVVCRAICVPAPVSQMFKCAHNKEVDDEVVAQMEVIVEKSIAFGFLLLTIGIITGSVWGKTAWGHYWQWDPKETWSLITWLIYAVFLHCRVVRGWAGKRAAWFAVLGFLAVMFTWFGVNQLPFIKSLHIYGKG